MSEAQTPVEQRVGRLLKQHQLTVAVAESLTGGLVCDRLTDVAGSSAYFMGGTVTYSNEAKVKLLGVKEQTLVEVGAVSARCASEMATGVRRLLDTKVGLSTTGIAGPGGATPQKPVGLVYIHLSAEHAEMGERFVFSGDRVANKRQSAEAALALLERYLQTLDPEAAAPPGPNA